MKFEVNIDKKYFFILLGAILVFFGAVFVFGGQSTPSNPGHPLTCITLINTSDEVPSPWSIFSYCPNGYVVTGCTSDCAGISNDQDLSIRDGDNGCLLDDQNCLEGGVTRGRTKLFTRCCKI